MLQVKRRLWCFEAKGKIRSRRHFWVVVAASSTGLGPLQRLTAHWPTTKTHCKREALPVAQKRAAQKIAPPWIGQREKIKREAFSLRSFFSPSTQSSPPLPTPQRWLALLPSTSPSPVSPTAGTPRRTSRPLARSPVLPSALSSLSALTSLPTPAAPATSAPSPRMTASRPRRALPRLRMSTMARSASPRTP